MLNEKSLRHQIAQTVVAKNCDAVTDGTNFTGGLFVGREVILPAQEGDRPGDRIARLQAEAPAPLLVCADLENGCGVAIPGFTQLPMMMGLGAAGDEQLAYQYGLATAKEARSVGINWAFAPVVDLNLNPRNPVVNIRGISDDPDRAVPLLKAVVKGMQDGGIAACAKHFPGDGVDWRDQHLVTTANSLTPEAYFQYHGRVFAELIRSGVHTIMAGHIALPCFQKERVNGLPLPATLSYELLTEFLRGEMGYEGLVVSDALTMGGFRGWYSCPEEAEIRAFKAGCDMMLWPHKDYVDHMISAVENGFVSRKRVEEAFQRVEALREKLGLFKSHDRVPLSDEDRSLLSRTREDCFTKSLTLVCDKNAQLPLRGKLRVAVIPIGLEGLNGNLTQTATAELEKRGFAVSVCRNVSTKTLPAIAQQHDKLLYLMYTKPHVPPGPLDFFDQDAGTIWAALTVGKEKSIVVSLGNPYFKNQYFEQAYTYINAYSPSVPCVKAVIRALCGETSFTADSPVDLDVNAKALF